MLERESGGFADQGPGLGLYAVGVGVVAHQLGHDLGRRTARGQPPARLLQQGLDPVALGVGPRCQSPDVHRRGVAVPHERAQGVTPHGGVRAPVGRGPFQVGDETTVGGEGCRARGLVGRAAGLHRAGEAACGGEKGIGDDGGHAV